MAFGSNRKIGTYAIPLASAQRKNDVCNPLIFVMRQANIRVLVYFYLSVTYNLQALFFELTTLRMCLSWGVYVLLCTAAPSVIDLSAKERATAFDSFLQKATGTILVVAALMLGR